VKRIVTGLLVAAMTLTGCSKAPAPSQGMAGMKDMPGMPGMPAAGADTSGVPAGSGRSRETRHHVCSGRQAPRSILVRAVGILKYAEPNLVYVNARVGGWWSACTRIMSVSVSSRESRCSGSIHRPREWQEEYLLHGG